MKRYYLFSGFIISALFCSNALANISVYGRAHVSVDQLDNGEETTLNIGSNSSRIGFRASHDIEPGLKVLVQIENTIRLDEGSGNWASRDSFVGLQGAFGLVRVGFFDTPLKIVRSRTDLFSEKVGDSRNIVRGGDVNLDRRFRNGLHYRSPVYNNLTLDIHYSTNDATGSTSSNDNDAISSAVSYQAKGLLLMLAYEQQNQLEAAARKGLRLGGSYQLNIHWRLTGFYQQSQHFAGGDRDAWGMGVRYSIKEYDFSAQLYQASAADAAKTGASMLAIGADRKLGKHLTLYTAAAFTQNDSAASFNVSGGGHGKALTVNPGLDATALSVGVIYNF